VAAQRKRGLVLSRAALAFAAAFMAALAALGSLGGATARGDELPTPQRSPDEVHRTVREVLDRPEYRRESPTLVERARRWVRDQLSRLLASLFRGDRGTVLAWIILGGLLTVVIVLSARFARSVTPDPGREMTVVVASRRSAREWRAEADAHEQAGEWKLALRARYRSLVADLASRGLVDEIPGRTAGEYRAEVTETVPGVASEFAGATELFERAWYGNRATGADDAARFRDLALRVLTGTRA
jgi:hypothetical protein